MKLTHEKMIGRLIFSRRRMGLNTLHAMSANRKCSTGRCLGNVRTDWEGVVGLEVHAQISSASKLFSGSGTNFGSPINANVSLFDAAIPGTLPVLNRRCVEAGVLTALALSCELNSLSLFDRKHYFYADLPAGYQITQQRKPLAVNGDLPFEVFTPGSKEKIYSKKSHVIQIQLEQDSGKSIHDTENAWSLVDLNRAGLGLMEIVFAPDLNSGEEAAALIKELSLILQCLKTCSCRMEEGALRVDANVSVRPRGSQMLGSRSEIKNLGSIRSVAQAVNYEIKRHIETIEQGGQVGGDTRSWDSDHRVTVAMRDKEIHQDYRFMPEPNLPPLRLKINNRVEYNSEDEYKFQSDSWPPPVNVDTLKSEVPELPQEMRQKLRTQLGLSLEASIVLVNDPILLSYFYDILNEKPERDKQLIANFLINEMLTMLNKADLSLENCSIPFSYVGEMVDLLQSNSINLVTGRKVLQLKVDGDSRTPYQIVQENKWLQISDEEQIRKICVDVLNSNPKLVQKYKGGKVKIFSAFMGEVAKKTKQKGNMALAEKILKELLKKTL